MQQSPSIIENKKNTIHCMLIVNTYSVYDRSILFYISNDYKNMLLIVLRLSGTMEKKFDFNEEFGMPKKLICKNFNKIQISVHPDFSGIYLCYQQAFKSLKADLSILTTYPEIHVWKDPNIAGYTIANACQWHLYWSQNTPKNINLLVHSFPKNEEKLSY